MDLTRFGRPRVVVTGLGALTSLGTVKTLWENLKAGRSGIRRIQSFDTSNVEVKIGSEVDFDPKEYLDYKEARRMSRCAQMAQACARMAMQDAGMTHEELAEESDRIGVVMGTALGGFEVSEQSTYRYKVEGRKPSPFAIISGLPNMPAHYISREVQAKGPLVAVSTACASGTQSVGEGLDLIRNDRADIVFAGGVEGLMMEYAILGFEAMTALATGYNDQPEAASRPFDANRNGFVYGEGAGVLILEKLEHALKRGARIYAEVLGYASSSDAFHIAAIDPEGKGAQRAMRWALEDAHLAPEDIDYINAHGTSTKANDAIETFAIKKLFGAHAYKLAISSTKSMIGHCMGAAGAIEAIACVMSLVEKVIHPTINYETPDPECDLDYVPNVARDANIRTALSNSLGLGGQNASLVLGAI